MINLSIDEENSTLPLFFGGPSLVYNSETQILHQILKRTRDILFLSPKDSCRFRFRLKKKNTIFHICFQRILLDSYSDSKRNLLILTGIDVMLFVLFRKLTGLLLRFQSCVIGVDMGRITFIFFIAGTVCLNINALQSSFDEQSHSGDFQKISRILGIFKKSVTFWGL